MEKRYGLEEISTMTGLTTRTLRTYLKNGLLKGEKENGKWKFTEENLKLFFSSSFVMEGVKIKSHGMVYDFIKEIHGGLPKSCFIHDIPGSLEEVEKITQMVLSHIKSISVEGMKEGITFSFYYNKKGRFGRFIVSGDLVEIHTIIGKIMN